MRLYVNTKEVPYLKNALRNAINITEDSEVATLLNELLARVTLCENLQNNERRAKSTERHYKTNRKEE